MAYVKGIAIISSQCESESTNFVPRLRLILGVKTDNYINYSVFSLNADRPACLKESYDIQPQMDVSTEHIT